MKKRTLVATAVIAKHYSSKKKAKNKLLTQGTSTGKPTKIRNAPRGWAPAPQSVAAMTPGEGPSMSSNLNPAQRGFQPTPKVRFGSPGVKSKKPKGDVYKLKGKKK